jgi:hypothetical protein
MASAVTATWWGYAEGNPVLVGVAGVIVAAAAVGYVVKRILQLLKDRR